MMGMGMGVGFSSPPPWTPAAVPGCILYGGAYLEARAVRAAQPVLYTAAANFSTLSANASVSDDADIPSGLAGTSVKLAISTAAAGYVFGAGSLIAGNRYVAQSWVKSDGAANASYRSASGGYEANSTSAAWALVTSTDATSLSDAQMLYRGATAGASAVYFKPVSIRNLSLQSYTPAYTTIPGSVLAQATATAQPWVSSDGLGIRYQGGDMLQWSAAASNVKCLHDGTGGTLIVAVRPSVINAANWLAATFLIDPGQVGIGINYDGASVGLYIGNGTGALGTSASAALALALEQTYVFTIRTTSGANNVNMRVNSTSRITTTLNNPSVADPFFGLKFGAHTAGNAQSVNGALGHPFVANRVLSDAECTQIEQYILAQATL